MNSFGLATATFALMISAASSAQAVLVTSLTNPTSEPMPSVNKFGPGPEVFGSGIVWTATNLSAVFGFTGAYGFGTNGVWDGGLGPMAATNDATSSMTFTF